MKATLKNTKEWKAVLNAMSEVVEDSMFIWGHDGISLRAIDDAHISLLEVNFPKSSFEKLEGEPSFFGLKIDDLKNIMNASNEGDIVELEIQSPSKMRISITGKYDMIFNLPLIERVMVNIPTPKVDYKSKVSLHANTLRQIFHNLQPISDLVTIICEKNKVEFVAKSELGDATIHLKRGDVDLYNLVSSEKTSSIYSLEYMAKIIRDLGNTTSEVKIEYSCNNPLRLKFKMPSETKIEYYLAPKIEI